MTVNNTFLAVNGRGVIHASCNPDGNWAVQAVLAEKACCLAADPQNRQVVYAGTNGSGIFRSGDGGQTWAALGLEGHIAKAVAVSPHDPRIIYAGTKPARMFVSRDGGQSWSELEAFRHIRGRRLWFSPAEPPDWRAYVQAIAISPTEPDVILAGIEFGAVVRSTDGGQSWSNHVRGTLRDCHDLKFHAANGDWVYEVGGGGAAVGRQNGRSWRKANAGLSKRYGVACAADPAQPEIWYSAVGPSPAKSYGEEAQAYLYRAAGGADWEPIGWQPHPLPQMPIALVTDPAAPSHLYAGLTFGDVWHSADYGDTWQKLPFNLGRIWRSMILI